MLYNPNDETSKVVAVEHHEAIVNPRLKIIHSEYNIFDDLIEKQPGWLLNSGILLLFISVAIVLVLASFIHYPDKLSAPFILTTENPPIDVVTMSSGQIAVWYVADGRQAKKNTTLAYIDNSANLEDVEIFANFVDQVAATTHFSNYQNHHIPKDLQMGDLRQIYSVYVQTLTSFQYLLRQRIVYQKMNTLKDKIDKHHQLDSAMHRQINLVGKELDLTQKDFLRNQQLNSQGVVSDFDFEKTESQFLQKQQQLESLKSSTIQNKIEIEQLNTQWMELSDIRTTSIDDYLIKLSELTLQFRNEHNQWKKRYMITAPISGVVSISPGMVENRTVNSGEVIASIIPTNTNDKIVAWISPQASGIGKIETDNRVLLQLDAYPYKEYGAVEAQITNASLLPVTDKEGQLFYEMTCELPQPIISTTGKELAFRQKLTGVAQIITKDKSILQRLLERLSAVKS